MRHIFPRALFLMLSIGLMTLSGCSKYSSPGKVKRLLTKGNWKITSIFIANESLTNDFSSYEFIFKDDNDIDVIGDETIGGTWGTSIEKNPTRLEIHITPFEPFYHLNADWTFTECTRNQMVLEVNTGSHINTMILRKVGS